MLRECCDVQTLAPDSGTQKQSNRAYALARHHRLKNTPAYQEQRRANDKKRRTHTCPEKLPCRACVRNRKARKNPDAPGGGRQTFPPYKKIPRLYWKMAVGLLVERDGWDCHLCKISMTWATVTIDHLIPQCIDPMNHLPSNLRLAHRRCNASKGASVFS